jgi:hypothetical protein
MRTRHRFELLVETLRLAFGMPLFRSLSGGRIPNSESAGYSVQAFSRLSDPPSTYSEDTIPMHLTAAHSLINTADCN